MRGASATIRSGHPLDLPGRSARGLLDAAAGRMGKLPDDR